MNSQKNTSTVDPSPQSLPTLLRRVNPSLNYQLKKMGGAPRSLRIRLLELGLVDHTYFQAELQGSRALIRLRGDTLLLRADEAAHLYVVDSSFSSHPHDNSQEDQQDQTAPCSSEISGDHYE